MTDQEKHDALKDIVGTEYPEEILSAYLDLAGRKIVAKTYPYSTEDKDVPTKYDFLQVEIAAYMLNKRGAEGQTAHSENGISRTYENADVPESMLSTITPFCGVIR